MVYGKLLRNQWKQFVRSLSPRFRFLAMAAIVFAALYVSGILIITGLFFDRWVDWLEPGAHTVLFMNEHLLVILASLFSLRFFFQKTPRLGIQPYLHLPIRRAHLVIFFQTASLASVHNLMPLLFFVPFWIQFVIPTSTFTGSLFWIGGVTTLVLTSHYANIILRTYLTVDLKRFFILFGVVLALIVADRMTAGHWVSITSSTLFDGLAAGSPILLIQLVFLAAFVFIYSSMLLRARLNDHPGAQRPFRLGSRAMFSNTRSQVANLMLLELQLIWRNKRPRTYLIFAIFFGTVYVALLLIDPRVSQNILMGALAGLFASGIFAVNHGQLMFAWESRYFDGVLTRCINTRSLVLSKLLTLQASCVVFFVISLPIFLTLAPDLVPLHASFLLYNAGITSVLMVTLAVHNRKRISIEKAGGFFNYEGFNLRHWLWFIPMALPPILWLFFMREQPQLGLLVLASAGAVGLLLTGAWSRVFEHVLLRRKYVMAAGFRQYEH